MIFFKARNEKHKKRNDLINEIAKEKNILNPEEVADQFLAKKTIINYKYKKEELYINNEASALYHLVNSTSKIEKLVDAIDLDECGTAMDIGANTGLFTYFLKKKYPSAKVFLFEPDERLFPIIERNLNGFDNCNLLPLAISDKDNDEIDFYINPNSAQTNSTIKEAVTCMEMDDVIFSKKIKTITIDTFCLQNNIQKLDAIKIDIQGAEFTALQSSPVTLQKTKILIAEICFLMPDTIPLLILLNKYYPYHKPINQIIMGADLKFFK
jgi:FkbM family methyltransferase